jgi:1,4-alpha-glucan branching enzyme
MRSMLTPDDIQTLTQCRHADPFGVLGMHERAGVVSVSTHMPGALRVQVLNHATESPVAELSRLGSTDIFSGVIPGYSVRFDYKLSVQWTGVDGDSHSLEDAYRFPPVLQDMDVWLLTEGTHRRPYECLGAHLGSSLGIAGVSFTVWAPNAKRVSVVGSFNQWDGRRHPMRLRRECGVWEIFIPGVAQGDLYKFEVLGADDSVVLKADPFAFYSQMRPETASVVYPLPAYVPMRADRIGANAFDQPLSIYEVHLASWRKVDGWRWLSYRELAATLVPYAASMGFTHIELLPVSEHPFDGSWGYQPVGMFAATSRFGTPEDFKFFVDAAHDAGLGVILDWVPAHFPSDAHGLAKFDGTHLYEYADPKEGFHQDWNTLIYNFGRTEVRNFLVSNALFWLERFGIDGLRVDAVASMLYRDYSRKDGEWIPNKHGGRENLEAIDFLRRMNHLVGTERLGAITLAEESTAFPGVSRPPSADLQSGGLGFHFKWNMGWMHDILRYAGMDPVHRRHHHNDLTFGLMYAFTENFVLPLSHDEVVHGKGSLLARMPGDEWQKFANLRALYGFMWAYPGKKLLFMGGELAQPTEWADTRELSWHLEQQPAHQGIQRLVRDLNQTYRSQVALHSQDVNPQGFQWVAHDDSAQSVLSFIRWAQDGQCVVVVCNFTPIPRKGYRIGVPVAGPWHCILNTDAQDYGGSGIDVQVASTETIAAHSRTQSLNLHLPPLSCIVLAPGAH